jgi:hypothetical protein
MFDKCKKQQLQKLLNLKRYYWLRHIFALLCIFLNWGQHDYQKWNKICAFLQCHLQTLKVYFVYEKAGRRRGEMGEHGGVAWMKIKRGVHAGSNGQIERKERHHESVCEQFQTDTGHYSRATFEVFLPIICLSVLLLTDTCAASVDFKANSFFSRGKIQI